ncbi:transposase [Candidatus Omnitrophus magneticus]|uniref:Transposase n=1 Tax=Candidatus Omnitrophus magneticus TaxID=1609969 RepID=A0A0F0CK42_9BACT|nr:transposase [Candidatus Omnitrophus magneticus]
MLGVAMYITIKSLLEKGLNKSQIARDVKHDWKTVDKIIKRIKSNQSFPIKKPHPQKLDTYREQIIEWMEQGLSGILIYQKLREIEVKISYSAIKRFLAGIKRKENIFVRIHTEPAEEAQVDFGYIGLTTDINGKRRKTWVFNMKLSYSRLDYYEKTYDQTVETFINCHKNAFKYFSGIPKTVRIDNLKAAILEANFYEPIFQQLYKDFSAHYGFTSIPCRIYRPNDKGKVESGIKYFKNNFVLGRQFKDGDDLDRQILYWLENTCNRRVHGTTRKIPKEVFHAEEKHLLLPLPLNDFEIAKVGTRKLYHDCHVFIDYNYYSAPFEYVGKILEIEKTKSFVKIYYENKLIATHPTISGKGLFSTSNSHYPKYKLYSETEYQEKYQAKMHNIGPFAEQMFFAILKDSPNLWSRKVQGIISLLNTYPGGVVDSACKRALAYQVYSYKIIKKICSNGSYSLPVEFAKEEALEYEFA